MTSDYRAKLYRPVFGLAAIYNLAFSLCFARGLPCSIGNYSMSVTSQPRLEPTPQLPLRAAASFRQKK